MPVATGGGSSPSFSKEADRIRFVPVGQILGGDDHLLEHADEAVHVVQPVVLQVQAVAAESGALGEEHTLCAGLGKVDQGADREGPAADDDGLGLGNFGVVREVDVAAAGRGELRTFRDEDLEGGPVVEREAVVGAGFGVPEVHHLADLLGLLGCEVVQLGAVDVGVVELPLVVVEVRPAAERRVGGDGLPAVVPDASRPEHGEELGVPCSGRRRARRSCSAC